MRNHQYKSELGGLHFTTRQYNSAYKIPLYQSQRECSLIFVRLVKHFKAEQTQNLKTKTNIHIYSGLILDVQTCTATRAGLPFSCCRTGIGRNK